VDGVSLEFYPGPTARDGGEAVHKRGSIRSVIGLALAYAPALAGASASVRMEGRQMETIATEATTPERPAPAEIVPPINVEAITRAVVRTELDEFRRTLAETAAAGRGDPFDAIRSMRGLGEMYVAGSDKAAALDVRRAFARALDDNITGDSAGVVTPGVIQDVKRIVNAGRPGIAAFGAQGLPDEGMAVTWPYLETGTALTDLFGAQPTGEKNEIVSGEVHIDLGSSNLITYAGGSDISYQLLRRSSPSYLEAYTRILLAAWALITDTAFVNAVEAAGTGSVVIDWAAATLEEMQEAALTASVAIKAATGQPAEFILAGDATFIAIGSKMTPAPIVNALGTATASTLSVSLSGLPVLHDPAVNVGTAVISNREAARWFEDGPFPATEEDVAKLGRNVAYWSMGAAGVFVPAGVVKSATS
jgi:hypothetical protein